MSDEKQRPNVRKSNFTMERQDMRDFKRIMLDLEDEFDFPIELKESHCLNTAVKLIIRSMKPQLIDEYLDTKEEKRPEERKKVHDLYKWYRGQFVELLNEVVDSRIESDKRRAPRITE